MVCDLFWCYVFVKYLYVYKIRDFFILKNHYLVKKDSRLLLSYLRIISFIKEGYYCPKKGWSCCPNFDRISSRDNIRNTRTQFLHMPTYESQDFHAHRFIIPVLWHGTYWRITSTLEPGFSGWDILGYISRRLFPLEKSK